jgi:hypothetical protein
MICPNPNCRADTYHHLHGSIRCTLCGYSSNTPDVYPLLAQPMPLIAVGTPEYEKFKRNNAETERRGRGFTYGT